MRQSNVIFGALAVAFVAFIVTRGSLPVYMSVLFGTAGGGGSEAGSSPGGIADGMVKEQDKTMGDIMQNPLFSKPFGGLFQ